MSSKDFSTCLEKRKLPKPKMSPIIDTLLYKRLEAYGSDSIEVSENFINQLYSGKTRSNAMIEWILCMLWNRMMNKSWCWASHPTQHFPLTYLMPYRYAWEKSVSCRKCWLIKVQKGKNSEKNEINDVVIGLFSWAIPFPFARVQTENRDSRPSKCGLSISSPVSL
jgi:hypothetical protein